MREADLRPKVWVVDDDEAIRRSLGKLLSEGGYEPILLASAEEFLARADPMGGCLLLDLRLDGMDGRELQSEIHRRGWPYSIVFLTGHGDVTSGVEAMKQGAVDFLLKPVRAQKLFEALRVACERHSQMRRQVAEQQEWFAQIATLSQREREVLELVLQGMLNKQIAGRLKIALRTVKLHRSNMFIKLKVNSVAEIARRAERLGLPAVR